MPTTNDRFAPGAFSEDSRFLMAFPQLWELPPTGDTRISPRLTLPPVGGLSRIYYGYDGYWLVGLDPDRVFLWNTRLKEYLIPLGCKTAGRNLTLDEWNKYLPGEPYQCTCPQYPPGKDAGDKCPAPIAKVSSVPAAAKAESAYASTTATRVHAKKKTRQ